MKLYRCAVSKVTAALPKLKFQPSYKRIEGCRRNSRQNSQVFGLGLASEISRIMRTNVDRSTDMFPVAHAHARTHTHTSQCISISIMCNTGYTQKNDAVSKVNKKCISHLTRAQRIPSVAATVQVSHALPAVRFSCLLRGQFPRWRRSRKRLSVCSVLRCPDL